MTRSEGISIGISLVAASAAGISAYYSYQAHNTSSAIQRPHIGFEVSLFESRADNGIQIFNSGMTPAQILNYRFHNDEQNEAHQWARKDLESIGWEYGNLVHHPLTGGMAISGGQSRPVISIDRRIGMTDISILDRLFNATSFEICYCDLSGGNCWEYTWMYNKRTELARNELSVANCVRK